MGKTRAKAGKRMKAWTGWVAIWPNGQPDFMVSKHSVLPRERIGKFCGMSRELVEQCRIARVRVREVTPRKRKT